MDGGFLIAATTALILAPLCFFLFTALKNAQTRARQLEVQNATLTSQNEALQRDAQKLARADEYLEQKAIAVTELHAVEKKLADAQADRERFLREKEEAVAARREAEKQVEMMRVREAEWEKRRNDWEAQKEEARKAAQASIMEVGQKLSSKLLEDHKREAEAAKKESEAIVKKTSEGLMEQMQQVTKSVAALQSRTGEAEQKMATVWRALTTPAAAGQMGEIGLENTLKNLDLVAGRDFVMQYSISAGAGGLRPDAVVFLPQDQVMVIDCKASKFVVEIEEAEEEAYKTELLAKLKDTMNKHLTALKDKDYAAAIKEAYRASSREGSISNVVNVMYLPSVGAEKILARADEEFHAKAQKAKIVVAGPTTLMGLLSVASMNIGMARQAKNQEQIARGIQDIMEYVSTVLKYAGDMGKSIKAASDNYVKLAGSANSRLLPKMRRVAAMGLKTKKDIPAPLQSYEMHEVGNLVMIEGEAETVEEEKCLVLSV